MTKAKYPKIASPRLRYRRKRDLQDTVVLELHVPASMIPWLEEFASWFGPTVERTAVFYLTSQLMACQEAMSKGGYGGPTALRAMQTKVEAFLADHARS